MTINLDAGRIADFLLEHRDLLALLNYPQVFEKHVSIPIDTKIYNTLMTRAKVGEVKDVLILLHGMLQRRRKKYYFIIIY